MNEIAWVNCVLELKELINKISVCTFFLWNECMDYRKPREINKKSKDVKCVQDYKDWIIWISSDKIIAWKQ